MTDCISFRSKPSRLSKQSCSFRIKFPRKKEIKDCSDKTESVSQDYLYANVQNFEPKTPVSNASILFNLLVLFYSTWFHALAQQCGTSPKVPFQKVQLPV